MHATSRVGWEVQYERKKHAALTRLGLLMHPVGMGKLFSVIMQSKNTKYDVHCADIDLISQGLPFLPYCILTLKILYAAI